MSLRKNIILGCCGKPFVRRNLLLFIAAGDFLLTARVQKMYFSLEYLISGFYYSMFKRNPNITFIVSESFKKFEMLEFRMQFNKE